MKVLDLFSGIGGFSLGLERAGFQTIAFCEIEPFCQKVLKKHWPDIPIYEDVRNVTAERLRSDGIVPDVITGGFPCQDISVAGKQAGIEGARSGLWSECARILGEFRPRYAIFENVTALISGEQGKWFERVLWDISQVGYDAEWHCIPASACGAHHQRDRIWVIAYPWQRDDGCSYPAESKRQTQESGNCCSQGAIPNPGSQRLSQSIQGGFGGNACQDEPLAWSQLKRILTEAGRARLPEPDLARVVNDVPNRVDRTKALGNAVVPQIPEIIGRAIMEVENENHH